MKETIKRIIEDEGFVIAGAITPSIALGVISAVYYGRPIICDDLLVAVWYGVLIYLAYWGIRFAIWTIKRVAQIDY